MGSLRRRQTTTRSIGSASVRELAGTAAAAVVEDTSHHNRKLSFGRQQLRMAQMERERLKTIVASPAGSVFDDDGETTAVASELEGRERAKLGGLSSGGLMGRSPSVAEELRAAGEVEEEDARRKELSPGTSGQEVEQREQRPKSKAWKIAVGVKNFLSSLATPPTISLVTALVCALVDPLKAVRPTTHLFPLSPLSQTLMSPHRTALHLRRRPHPLPYHRRQSSLVHHP